MNIPAKGQECGDIGQKFGRKLLSEPEFVELGEFLELRQL